MYVYRGGGRGGRGGGGGKVTIESFFVFLREFKVGAKADSSEKEENGTAGRESTGLPFINNGYRV